jgi:hypothetical protein
VENYVRAGRNSNVLEKFIENSIQPTSVILLGTNSSTKYRRGGDAMILFAF